MKEEELNEDLYILCVVVVVVHTTFKIKKLKLEKL